MAKLNFNDLSQKWQKQWENEKTYIFDPKAGKSVYSIDTPPPTVSGTMHIGHALGYTQADVIARYKKMAGFNVFYPFGYDDNGLATERFVEKKIKKRAKDFEREKFRQICLNETQEAEKELKKSFQSIGLGCDWSQIYRTIDNDSIKIAQLSFLDLWNKKRVYRKKSPSMYCVHCETSVAQAELEDKEKETLFSEIFFELENGKKISIQTTRPELLAACVAVFVNPDDKNHSNLIGKKVKVPLFEKWVKIKADKRVDPEKGSGIVMCCTFGDQTDMEWYHAYGLDLKLAIGTDGKMLKNAGKYEGLKVKEAREKILEDLKQKGFLGKQKKIVHEVNTHERCGTEIEFLVTEQWFLKYLDLKKKFIQAGKKLKWYPKHMQIRYENWINGLQWDWSISRQRFFGVPIPVWYCEKCDSIKVADEKQLPIDPVKMKITEKCECGGTFKGEEDVFDTWFTSSLTPQINAKWGLKDERMNLFPMSLRPQGHDIITLWAFNTVVKGLMHHEKIPWKEIFINGFALDSKGRKMSKSRGNVVDPEKVIEKFSADALRYWACSVTTGEDVPYQEKELTSGTKFLNKIYNASKFVKMVAKNAIKKPEKKDFEVEDLWILSRLNKVIQNSTKNMDNYDLSKCLNETRNFFWLEFANFYLEEIKHRVYNKNVSKQSADAAKWVLLQVVDSSLKLLAPFVPHITEEAWRNILKNKKSIHLEKWPQADKSFISAKDEETGEKMNNVITDLRKIKAEKGLALNEEVSEAKIFVQNEKEKQMIQKSVKTIKNTLNIKNIHIEIGKKSAELK